jgi:hypothetical protein
MLLLAGNFVVGLAGGDFNAAARQRLAAKSASDAATRELRKSGGPTSPEWEEAKQRFKTAAASFRASSSRMTLHMLLGIASALVTVLVHSIAITYFIGTSRWCKEVCETYGLPSELAERSTHLKRKTFPWALTGIFCIIGIMVLGAAADPLGANAGRSYQFVLPHYLAAMAGLAIIALAFWIEIIRIAENYAVIEEILGEVRRIRAENNLPQEEVAAP